jgi:hypothetical protein
MYLSEHRIENDPFERKVGVARVAVPSSASDKIDVSITVNVKCAATDIGGRRLAQKVARPSAS